MSDAPFIEPTNKTIVSGEPDVRDYEVTGTVTNMKAGRLVTKGASDGEVIIGSKTAPNFGWISYQLGFQPDKPANIDTAYTSGDMATIISGPGVVLKGYAEEAINKGDLVCAGSDGAVRKLYPGSIKTMKIPFEKKTTEFDSTYNLPEGAIVLNTFVEVVTNVAASTIDVGILSTEGGGDADGFIDGLSCAAAGTIVPIAWDATADADNTIGLLISSAMLGGTSNYGRIPKLWVGDGTATSVSYTTSNHAIDGFIYILFAEPGADDKPVGIAEETIAAAGNILLRSLI